MVAPNNNIVNEVVIREREVANYLVCRKIPGEVKIRFDDMTDEAYFVFTDSDEAIRLIGEYQQGVSGLDLAIQIADFARSGIMGNEDDDEDE